MTPPRSVRAQAGVALISCGLLLLLCGRAPLSGPVEGAWATARALVTQHTITVPEGRYPTVLRNTHRYVAAPLGPALLLVPATVFAVERPAARALLGGAGAALLGALLFGLFFAAARRSGTRGAVAATVLLAATFVLVAGRQADGAIASTLALFVLVEGAARRIDLHEVPAFDWRVLGLGLAAGVLGLFERQLGVVLICAVTIVAAPLAQAKRANQSPWRAAGARMVLFVVGLAPGTLLACWHARLLSLWSPTAPLDLGLDGLLLSTGKSIFIYAPPLLLGFWALPWLVRQGRHRGLLLRLAVVFAVLLPVACSSDWHGDPSWGPARLTPLVPMVLIAFCPWLESVWTERALLPRTLVVAACAGGLLVNLLGCAIRPESYLRLIDAEKNRTGAAGWFIVAPDQAHFIPQFSPVSGHAWLLDHLVHRNSNLDRDPPWMLITPAPAQLNQEWPTLFIDLAAVDKDRSVRALWAALVTFVFAAGAALLLASRKVRSTPQS